MKKKKKLEGKNCRKKKKEGRRNVGDDNEKNCFEEGSCLLILFTREIEPLWNLSEAPSRENEGVTLTEPSCWPWNAVRRIHMYSYQGHEAGLCVGPWDVEPGHAAEMLGRCAVYVAGRECCLRGKRSRVTETNVNQRRARSPAGDKGENQRCRIQLIRGEKAQSFSDEKPSHLSPHERGAQPL